MTKPVDETTAYFRALVVRRAAIAVLVLALVLALGVILYAVVAIRTAQVTNTGTLNTSNKTLRVLIDCTTEQGKCYQRGQAQTGEAVGSLNTVTVRAASYAAACAAQGLTGANEIYRCALHEFAKHPPNPLKSKEK